jgi:hypothetical protein
VDDRASGDAWEIRRLTHRWAREHGVEKVTIWVWR